VLDSESVQQRLRDMHVLAAVSERIVVGTLAWAVNGSEGHLRGMAVLPDWHGKGVAAALLRAAEAEARGEYCTRLTLDTTEPLDRAKRFTHGMASPVPAECPIFLHAVSGMGQIAVSKRARRRR
jgi:GNAT superfamily N-acetyltransferase